MTIGVLGAVALSAAAIGLFVLALVRLLGLASGWSRLAKRYPVPADPRGACFARQSGRIGFVSYNGVLTFHVVGDGLWLSVNRVFRVGHPPMFIPWTELRESDKRSMWLERFVFVDVGSPKVARIQVPRMVWQARPSA